MLAYRRWFLLCLLAALAAGCSTPCGAPGRLCAPAPTITSLPPRPAEAAPPPAVAYAVPAPGTTTVVPPQRLALLLPLHSATLGAAAEALRDGFLAAWQREPEPFSVDVIDSGEQPQEVLASYAGARQEHELLVGPLARTAVGAVAASALVDKPTIALTTPEGYGSAGAPELPPAMLAIGLSLEEEARQVAHWAAGSPPQGSALVIATASSWQRRIAAAFAAQWQQLQLPVSTLELDTSAGYLNQAALQQLRSRLQTAPPALLFSAMGADQTRQLRAALAAPAPDGSAAPTLALALYGTSALNAGADRPSAELDGVRLLDLPWQVQREHPAVMGYPRPAAQQRPDAADLERLYALGIDAYRVAHALATTPGGRFRLDGVTGQLTVSFGNGVASFARREQPAIYRNGVAQAIVP